MAVRTSLRQKRIPAEEIPMGMCHLYSEFANRLTRRNSPVETETEVNEKKWEGNV